MLRFHGVLGPAAAWRSAVIPSAPKLTRSAPRRRWDRRVERKRHKRLKIRMPEPEVMDRVAGALQALLENLRT
jgi:hypothetical protein